jgi:hypothetical protein
MLFTRLDSMLRLHLKKYIFYHVKWHILIYRNDLGNSYSGEEGG